MPFQQLGTAPLQTVVNVRMSHAEKQQLKLDAEVAGLTVSAYMRRRAFGRRVIANADAVMLREMRRMGGLLKHIHVQSDGAYSRETARALSAVRAFIEELGGGSRRT